MLIASLYWRLFKALAHLSRLACCAACGSKAIFSVSFPSADGIPVAFASVDCGAANPTVAKQNSCTSTKMKRHILVDGVDFISQPFLALYWIARLTRCQLFYQFMLKVSRFSKFVNTSFFIRQNAKRVDRKRHLFSSNCGERLGVFSYCLKGCAFVGRILRQRQRVGRIRALLISGVVGL